MKKWGSFCNQDTGACPKLPQGCLEWGHYMYMYACMHVRICMDKVDRYELIAACSGQCGRNQEHNHSRGVWRALVVIWLCLWLHDPTSLLAIQEFVHQTPPGCDYAMIPSISAYNILTHGLHNIIEYWSWQWNPTHVDARILRIVFLPHAMLAYTLSFAVWTR